VRVSSHIESWEIQISLAGTLSVREMLVGTLEIGPNRTDSKKDVNTSFKCRFLFSKFYFKSIYKKIKK